MPRFTLILAICLVLSAAPSMAADITDSGAEHLETLFTKIIENQKSSLAGNGGSLVTEGDITVEQGDGYYAVTLPSMTFKNNDGMEAEIGLLAINVTPTEKSEEWKMSIAIPTPVLYADAEGGKTTRLDIGEQIMSGVWNERLENFSKLIASYKNLELSHYARQDILTIGKLDVAVNLEEVKKDHWSGPTHFSFSGVNFGKPETDPFLNAEKITMGMVLDEFSPKAQEAALQNILAASEKDEENPDTHSLFLDLFRTGGNSFKFQGSAEKIEMNFPDITPPDTKAFFLGDGSFSFESTGMRTGLLNKKINITYNDLQLPESNGLYHGLIPRSFVTNFFLNNLPIADIIESLHKIFPSGSDKKMSRQIAALQTMITLPQILSKAGTTMEIKDSHYVNKHYDAKLNGQLIANPDSMIGTTGTMTLTLKGVDDVVTYFEEKRPEANKTDKKKIDQNVKWLQILKKISKKEEDVHICTLSINEKAKLFVNGSPIDTLDDEPSEEITE